MKTIDYKIMADLQRLEYVRRYTEQERNTTLDLIRQARKAKDTAERDRLNQRLSKTDSDLNNLRWRLQKLVDEFNYQRSQVAYFRVFAELCLELAAEVNNEFDGVLKKYCANYDAAIAPHRKMLQAIDAFQQEYVDNEPPQFETETEDMNFHWTQGMKELMRNEYKKWSEDMKHRMRDEYSRAVRFALD